MEHSITHVEYSDIIDYLVHDNIVFTELIYRKRNPIHVTVTL